MSDDRPAPTSLDDVRERIDAVDHEIVGLLAARAELVAQVVTFKRDAREVPAPARVEQVVANVRQLASERQLDPDLVECVYRPMIAWFTDQQLRGFERDS